MKDMDRARMVYKEALKVIPHAEFSFAKVSASCPQPCPRLHFLLSRPPFSWPLPSRLSLSCRKGLVLHSRVRPVRA